MRRREGWKEEEEGGTGSSRGREVRVERNNIKRSARGALAQGKSQTRNFNQSPTLNVLLVGWVGGV